MYILRQVWLTGQNSHCLACQWQPPWAAQYNTWLLIKLTPKGVVFYFLLNGSLIVMHSVLLKVAVVDARKLESGSAILRGLPAWALFFEGGFQKW